MSSIVRFQGVPWATSYAATKTYVQLLAKDLHVELAPAGIDVLATVPSATQSKFVHLAGMTMGHALTP
jgi:hypothetical protein